jgi:hypothetical protein
MQKIVLSLLLIVIMLTACAQSSSKPQAASGEPEPSPVEEVSARVSNESMGSDTPGTNIEQLKAIKEKLSDHLNQFERRHPVKFIGIGVGSDHILIMLRKSGDFEQPLTEEEVQKLKQSMYDDIGVEFPVKMEIADCCSREADISGKITEIEGERILVIDDHKKNGNSNDPVAVWFTLTEDGKIVRSGEKETVAFDKLKVGMQVKAWFTGIMLDSYPGQTTALKAEIQQ